MKRIILLAIGLVLLTGCGSKRNTGGTVSGTIRYKGQPVNGATLHLLPASGKDRLDIPIPVTQEGTFRGTNIPPGEYKIFVEAAKLPPQAAKGPKIPKNMSPGKAEELKKKYQQAYGNSIPTIAYPDKYKNARTTDLKCTINEGEQNLDLDLKG
ncbi:MAG TPA: carboxypeptidase-like regulatory domain-containing protein [Gemmataceae bacterium]|nr:carboxypeptidase-like regulatory domain-containing protein [Gemmataceae bacterium]